MCAAVALLPAWRYLLTRNLKYDAISVAVTEVGLAFLAANLVTGSIWGRIIWGIWWTWDARLTSALVCWLLYAGYLMLRRAIEEPTARARIAAVFNIFAFADVPIVIFSIKWWRTQHPQPVFWGGGSIDPAMYLTAVLNLVALVLLGRHAIAHPPPAGGSPARNRFDPPLRPRCIRTPKWIHAISRLCFTAF